MDSQKDWYGGFVPGPKPLCPFCSEPWTDDMIRVFEIDAMHGEGSYDLGPEDERATAEISCGTCDRLIYRRQFGDGAWR